MIFNEFFVFGVVCSSLNLSERLFVFDFFIAQGVAGKHIRCGLSSVFLISSETAIYYFNAGEEDFLQFHVLEACSMIAVYCLSF